MNTASKQWHGPSHYINYRPKEDTLLPAMFNLLYSSNCLKSTYEWDTKEGTDKSMKNTL